MAVKMVPVLEVVFQERFQSYQDHIRASGRFRKDITRSIAHSVMEGPASLYNLTVYIV